MLNELEVGKWVGAFSTPSYTPTLEVSLYISLWSLVSTIQLVNLDPSVLLSGHLSHDDVQFELYSCDFSAQPHGKWS
jgi:hypothetical protein